MTFFQICLKPKTTTAATAILSYLIKSRPKSTNTPSRSSMQTHRLPSGADKSAEPDEVYMRAIKAIDNTGWMHAHIATAVMRLGCYPQRLHRARTCLIPKNGASDNILDWRPTTVFAITRRIINKMLDAGLRKYVKFSDSQQDFISQSGCLKNTDKLNRLLQHAKCNKKDVHVILVDIKKAFDSIGYKHLELVLKSLKIPLLLRNVCMVAIRDNITCIYAARNKSLLRLSGGMAQGDPLSLVLFNLAIDDIISELDTVEMKQDCGYSGDREAASVVSFAGHTAAIGRDLSAAQEPLDTAEAGFVRSGLRINAMKANWLAVTKGKACYGSRAESDNDDSGRIVNGSHQVPSLLLNGQIIFPIARHCIARYLGAHFSPFQMVDEDAAGKAWRKQFNNFVNCSKLRPFQKLQMLQQYVAPALNYVFRITPQPVVSTPWLQDFYKRVRCGILQIIDAGGD